MSVNQIKSQLRRHGRKEIALIKLDAAGNLVALGVAPRQGQRLGGSIRGVD